MTEKNEARFVSPMLIMVVALIASAGVISAKSEPTRDAQLDQAMYYTFSTIAETVPTIFGVVAVFALFASERVLTQGDQEAQLAMKVIDKAQALSPKIPSHGLGFTTPGALEQVQEHKSRMEEELARAERLRRAVILEAGVTGIVAVYCMVMLPLTPVLSSSSFAAYASMFTAAFGAIVCVVRYARFVWRFFGHRVGG